MFVWQLSRQAAVAEQRAREGVARRHRAQERAGME